MNYARSIYQENLLLLNPNQLAFFGRPQALSGDEYHPEALPPVCACDRPGRACRHGFPGRAGEPVEPKISQQTLAKLGARGCNQLQSNLVKTF
ncbi:MAG: hypothetical protein EAZ78_18910 [Oscillatoriales cyanobacterium]|nr:MAG: hypothetical protein EAZ98_23840 [Oscillatoriales cyanobacterium]TAE02641.1 MAG: hypothetical protein EAZ96_15360 [Oscillatoriales cyanobacterium]TAF01241.1 MAG: hypothetical protein EAZ78_18910 [Oscillatoriales cyanobacterium]TAF68619.1 MAG: hypothetical protein EAZ59_10590 [Oscillatoriales cyanobacterium]